MALRRTFRLFGLTGICRSCEQYYQGRCAPRTTWRSVTMMTAFTTAILFYVKYVYWDDPMLFVEYARPENLHHRYVNEHQYAYTINNSSLYDGNVFLLIFVPSDPEKVNERNFIRQTWGGVKQVAGENIVTVFGTAQRATHGDAAGTNQISAAVKAEYNAHHDIIQGDFIDSYKNLTYKTIMAFHWVTNYCPNAKYFLKSDDDTMPNIFKIIQLLKSSDGKLDDVMLCRRVNGNPRRSMTRPTKWDVPRKYYFPSFFPEYCGGPSYLMSTTVLSTLYEVSSKVPFLFLEDVYLGLCREYAGIKISDYLYADRDSHEAFEDVHTFVMKKSDTLTDWDAMWKTILSSTTTHLH